MSARTCRLDIERNPDGEWFWRFIAGNGRQLARSSETYKRRAACERAAGLTLGLPATAFRDGLRYRYNAPVEVRLVDERGSES